MSSPTDRTEKHEDLSAYAPKWVRDRNQEKHHEFPGVARGEFPAYDEQIKDRARARRPVDESFQGEAALPLPRSLDPEFVREPRPASRGTGRLAALGGGLTIAAAVGAAIALLITSKFPSEINKALGLSTVKTGAVSRVAGETLNTPEPQSSPAARLTIASTDPRPIDEDPGRITSVRAALERPPTFRGVTDNEVRLGISAPFTGSAKEVGNQMKLGIETAFNLINDSGGMHGRQLRLVAADDGYEPTRAAETMKELYEKQQVFGFVGNVGTPTAVVALPYALERRTLFFGAFTGAGLLRRDPPDRYVFNYRASYAEETDAVVRYLVKMRGLRPEQIAVFAQKDAYGDSGFAG